MPRLRLQMGLLGYIALSMCVLINMFYLQPTSNGGAKRVELGPSPEATALSVRLPAPASTKVATTTAATPPAHSSIATTRDIQRELDARNYSIGTSDGVAGLVTRAAIMAYEFDHALPLTGEPTENLLAIIILGSAKTAPMAQPTQRIGPHAEQVIRTVQQSLAGLGFGPIKLDGFPGEETVRAIKRFEHAQGMPETGRISSPLVARLARLAALGQVHTSR